MTLTVTITGVDGFVGRHLARIAQSAGHRVLGTSRAAEPDAALAALLSDYRSADLRHTWPSDLRADVVIHLAGLAAVGPSFGDPQAYIAANSAMVTTMCESLLQTGAATRVVGVSTGAVYGAPAEGTAQSEVSPLGFTSPYVVSKILVENQLAYYRGRGLETLVARPFNHIGPGQGAGFLVPDLISRVRALAPGSTLSVGDLSTRRDYTDVRDVARAYLELATAEAHSHSVYNVASGRARSGEDILVAVCSALGVDVPPVTIDATRVRANDPRIIVGDASRLSGEFGWRPRIDIEQSIAETAG